MVHSNRVPRVVWCRFETHDKPVADALVKILDGEGRPCMRLRDIYSEAYVVRSYCNSKHFDCIYVRQAVREVEAARKAAAQVSTVDNSTGNSASSPAPARRKCEHKRCEHWDDIKRFFAVARDAGLPTGKDSDGPMRQAISYYFGRIIFSRSELAASDWQLLTGAVELGHLVW